MNKQVLSENQKRRGWSFFLQVALLLIPIITVVVVAHSMLSAKSRQLEEEVRRLNEQVERLQQMQGMPSLVLDRYRNSICYIFGIYDVGVPQQPPTHRTRISGTGFVVADGLIATNRHVAQPWYKDHDSEMLIATGATPALEKLVAYFPGSATPVVLSPAELAPDEDLALVRMKTQPTFKVQPLVLATQSPKAGDLVTVLGYPMGLFGMMVKAPAPVYARLASQREDQRTASRLAALSLIRPSATFGHLGDIIGNKLIYDAPTAQGASGGPVFDSRGEVVAINSAYLDGFRGGTLGISSQALRPLIEKAKHTVAIIGK